MSSPQFGRAIPNITNKNKAHWNFYFSPLKHSVAASKFSVVQGLKSPLEGSLALPLTCQPPAVTLGKSL